MTMRRILSASAPMMALLLASPSIVKAQEGAAQRAGEALDNAGRNIRRGVQNAFPRARMAVHEQQVVARVYSRLHWDKALVGSALEVEVFADGTTVLRGAVPDEATRKRASALTRDTVGVTRVVDELVVAPTRVIEAPASTVVVPPGTTIIESTPAPAPPTTVIKP